MLHVPCFNQGNSKLHPDDIFLEDKQTNKQKEYIFYFTIQVYCIIFPMLITNYCETSCVYILLGEDSKKHIGRLNI